MLFMFESAEGDVTSVSPASALLVNAMRLESRGPKYIRLGSAGKAKVIYRLPA